MNWHFFNPRMTPEHLGLIPLFLNEDDPRSAAEQIDANYAHGGGWRPFKGFKFNPKTYTLQYPGDPLFHPLAKSSLRNETILFYDYSWLLILQKDGSWEVSRLD